jgi:hypothetical protein
LLRGRSYRALISVPVSADSDAEAWRKATQYAHSLKHDGSAVPAGLLELLGALVDDRLEIIRVVEADPALLRQLPPDWRP